MERGGGGLGSRLLKEVKGGEVGLADLLSTLRSTISFNALSSHAAAGLLHPILNVPSIDRLLQNPLYDLANNPPATSTTTTTNVTSNEYSAFFADAGPEHSLLPPPIIEISSDKTCAGKTQLLYYITAISVLPPTWNGVYIGGNGGAAVVLDCDGRFDGCGRLKDVAVGYIRRRVLHHLNIVQEEEDQEITEEDVDELVRLCLDHVHIFRPQSSAALLSTIKYVPSYTLNTSNHVSGDRNVGCILIDGISAFYYVDKMSSLVSTSTSATSSQEVVDKFSLIETYNDITTAIRDVSVALSSTVVITNVIINSAEKKSTAEGKTPPYPTHLPNAYTYGGFLTARVVLSRDKVAQFHDGISLKEAWDERGERQSVLEKSGASGWVESAVRKNTTVGVAATAKEEGGWFWFWLGEDGIVMDKLEE